MELNKSQVGTVIPRYHFTLFKEPNLTKYANPSILVVYSPAVFMSPVSPVFLTEVTVSISF